MEEVKTEKFGSRNSTLKSLLTENKINFLSNIWVITCRASINADKNKRYLVCIEVQYDEIEYKDLLNNINKNISILFVKFNEENKQVFVENLKTNKKGEMSYDDFKKRIIEVTGCNYVDSYALGSKESSPLSRYFRENMGKGFALTDIDFYLTKRNIFIEEKNFVIGNIGYVGIGQCISFKEIINDIFVDLELKIICISKNEFYIADLKQINCHNSEIISGWGKMVAFDIVKISKKDLINYLQKELK